MPDVPPWARVAGDVNVGVRRGAWYRVIRLTPEAAWLDLTHRTLSVPRECLEQILHPASLCDPRQQRGREGG